MRLPLFASIDKGTLGFLMVPLWFFDQAPMVLPWWATHDKRFKLWPAWPCQSCMGRLEGIPNSTGGES